MTWGAIAGAAVTVIGGAMASSAAGDAADAQLEGSRAAAAAQERAAAQADATQRYFYDTNRGDNSSFLNNGRAANNQLAMLMGLNPSAGGYGGGYGSNSQSMQPNMLTADAIRKELLPKFSTGGSSGQEGAKGYGSWESGYYGPDASNSSAIWYPGSAGEAATIDEAGLKSAIDARLASQTQQQQQYQSYQDQQAQAAQNAQNNPDFGKLTRNFTMADRDADPVYQSGLQFGLDQGVQGINRMAAANGGTDNGAVLKALARFGNDYGSTKAAGAYDRFNNNNTTLYNRYAGLSGSGQTASNMIGAAGMNASNQISGSQMALGGQLGANAMNAGDTRAASAIGRSNAMTGTIGSLYGVAKKNNLFGGDSYDYSGYQPASFGAGGSYAGNPYQATDY